MGRLSRYLEAMALPMKAPAMKAMKAAMKAPMKAKKAMKVSKVAKGKNARAVVFRGGKEKTGSGKTKAGKIVSKAQSAAKQKAYATSALKKWIEAVKQARKQLNVVGFCAVNGKTPQGKALYAKVKSILGK